MLIGNGTLLLLTDLSPAYRMGISIMIVIYYSVCFYKLVQSPKALSLRRIAGVAVLLSLGGMLIACILTSIGMRLSIDSILMAGLKGVIPLFVFALVFAAPFWIPIALLNYFFLSLLYRKRNRPPSFVQEA